MTPNKSGIFVAFILLAASCVLANAAAPAHGKQRLRELAVLPSVALQCNFKVDIDGNTWRISDGSGLPDDIAALKQELKQDPDNLEKLLNLAYFYGLNRQTNESGRTWDYARAVCRSRLTSRPNDGLLLVDLGKALCGLNKYDEAESVYRKAVTVASNQWQCWSALGDFLQHHAYSIVVSVQKPAGEDLKRAEAWHDEGARCMVRAMALATNEANAFIQHAGYAGECSLYDAYLHHFRDGTLVDARTMMRQWGIFSPEAVADLRKAADLSPQNPELLGVAAFFDFSSGVVKANPDKPDPDNAADSSRRYVHQVLERLQKLSEHSDNKTASKALQTIAMLNLMMKNTDPSFVEVAHRAVKLDPTREDAWNLWMGLAAEHATEDELVSISESRLKQKDSALNHLLLGKMFARQSKWDQAEAEAESALLLEPNNVPARLMQVAIIIRQSTDDASLNAAAAPINALQTLLAQLPEGDDKQARIREYTLNFVIVCGLLTEEQYHQKAKSVINDFIAQHPDDEDAPKIREALE